jgi:hypothetical protein
MAWTRSNQIATSKLQVFTFSMTADGVGAFTDEDSPDFPMGSYLVGVKVKKGGVAPDSSIDVTLKDEFDIDMLGGSGAAIDISSTAKMLHPEDDNGGAMVKSFQGVLSLGIANNATASAVVQGEVHIAVPMR